MKLNIDLKKILHIRGKKNEENAPLPEQLYALSFRKLADIGVKILKNSKITPNQITVVRAIIFLLPIFYFFSRGSWIGNILGVVCCALNSLFDILDGNLARAKSLTSELGSWLDHSLDRITLYLVLVGIILGSYRLTQNNIFLVTGIFVLSLHGMMIVTSVELGRAFGENIFFDYRFKRTIYDNKKSTFFDKICVNMFIFNSFCSYLFFAVRYQVLFGAVFNIMPYMVFYWIFAFAVRLVFLYSVYSRILTEKKSQSVFINELKKRYQKRSKI